MMLRPSIFRNNQYDMMDTMFNNFEKSFFGDFGTLGSGFQTDIQDQGDHYLLEAELPGFQKEDIHIDMDGDYLTISAEHKDEVNDEDKEHNYIRRERRYGSFKRSFNVAGIETDAIKAAYKNGVLELTLPKKTEQIPASRQIEIQ